MAKVYEALRRAEQERKRRSGEPKAPMSAIDWDPSPGAPEVPAQPVETRDPFWKRWMPTRRGRKAGTPQDMNKRRISLLQPDSYVAEQFRALRGRIDSIAAQTPIKTVALTSPLPGEGKTTAAINLAVVTAMSLGRRVLLIDCDLRRPKVHGSLGLRPEAGLAEVLTGQASLEQAILKIEGLSLEVLAVRDRPTNPSELLASQQMRELVAEVSASYDRVILDTPAALGLPDAKIVSELCDGMVVVVRADVTTQQDVQATLEIMDRRRILGLLLNGAEVDQSRYGYTS
jgi:capsular exopolysaccharide synthesis family protein